MKELESKFQLFLNKFNETRSLSISLISRAELVNKAIKKEDNDLQELLIKIYILTWMNDYKVDSKDNVRMKVSKDINSSVSEEFLVENDIATVGELLLFKKAVRDFINDKKGFSKILKEDYFADEKVMDVLDSEYSLGKFLKSFAWRFNFISFIQDSNKAGKQLKKEVKFILDLSQSKEINQVLSKFNNISDLYKNSDFKKIFNYMPELSHVNKSNVAFRLIKNIEKNKNPLVSDLAYLMLVSIKDNISDFSKNIGMLKSDLYEKIKDRDIYINSLLEVNNEICVTNKNSIDINVKELWKTIYYVVNTSNVNMSLQKDGLSIKYKDLCDSWKEHVDKVFKNDLKEDIDIINNPDFLMEAFKDIFKVISNDYKLVVQYEMNNEEQYIKVYSEENIQKNMEVIIEKISTPNPELLKFLINYAYYKKESSETKENISKIINDYIEDINIQDQIENLVMKIDNLDVRSSVVATIKKW